jgi:hypothetical protein
MAKRTAPRGSGRNAPAAERQDSVKPASVTATRIESEGALDRFEPAAASKPERRVTTKALEFWRRLTANRPFPSLADVTPEAAGELWPNLFVVRLAEEPGDYTFVRCGARLIEAFGKDPTGQRLVDVFPSEIRTRVLYFHRAAASMQNPIDMAASWQTAEGEILFRVILMPLGEGRVDHLLGCANYRRAEDKQ